MVDDPSASRTRDLRFRKRSSRRGEVISPVKTARTESDSTGPLHNISTTKRTTSKAKAKLNASAVLTAGTACCSGDDARFALRSLRAALTHLMLAESMHPWDRRNDAPMYRLRQRIASLEQDALDLIVILDSTERARKAAKARRAA